MAGPLCIQSDSGNSIEISRMIAGNYSAHAANLVCFSDAIFSQRGNDENRLFVVSPCCSFFRGALEIRSRYTIT